MNTEKKQVANITAVTLLKGIAIIMVIVVYASQILTLPESIKFVTRLGQLGCQIFFVVSAFTLCLSYERNNYSPFKFFCTAYKRSHPHGGELSF